MDPEVDGGGGGRAGDSPRRQPERGLGVEKIGVLLVVGQHRILSDIVRDVLVADPSITLVGDVADDEDTEAAVARSGCDAVVWLIDGADRAIAPPALLRRNPQLRVLAVAGDSGRATVWWMHPQHRDIKSLAPTDIAAELHGRS